MAFLPRRELSVTRLEERSLQVIAMVKRKSLKWNDGSSKIKRPTAEVLFLDLKWFFNILKALSSATFFHLLSQPPVHLYLLYPTHCSRNQGAVLLVLGLLVCLTVYWLICLQAYLHLELYQYFKLYHLYVSQHKLKIHLLLHDVLAPLAFVIIVFFQAWQILYSCAHIFFPPIESLVVSWSVLAKKINSMFLAIFHSQVAAPTICGHSEKWKCGRSWIKSRKKCY